MFFWQKYTLFLPWPLANKNKIPYSLWYSIIKGFLWFHLHTVLNLKPCRAAGSLRLKGWLLTDPSWEAPIWIILFLVSHSSCPLRRECELRPGFSCDKNRKLQQNCKQWWSQHGCCNDKGFVRMRYNFHIKRRAKSSSITYRFLKDTPLSKTFSEGSFPDWYLKKYPCGASSELKSTCVCNIKKHLSSIFDDFHLTQKFAQKL